MGRYTTGACSTKECMRLNISDLKRSGFFRPGCEVSGSYHWTRGDRPSGSIKIHSYNLGQTRYIILSYGISRHGKTVKIEDRIDIESIPSNLGIGEVLFFKCPSTNRRCKTLYTRNGFDYFRSRQYFGNNIFYEVQMVAKRDIHNTNYWNLKRGKELKELIEKQNTKNSKWRYNGEQTKWFKRLQKLNKRLNYLDDARWMECFAFLENMGAYNELMENNLNP